MLVDRIDFFVRQINNKSFWRFFSRDLSEKKSIYLYGNVGTGKTMLMQYFFRNLHVPKLMIHYQDFTQSLHKDIHRLQNQKTSKNHIIKIIAKNYAKEAQIICIDEFEIKDITDAMIIGPLLLELIKHKLFIFITSNTRPEDLYKDGLQRRAFLPIIKEINQKFDIMYLDSNHDYRLDKIIHMIDRRIIYPINEDNKITFDKLIMKLTDGGSLIPADIEVFGRQISFATVSHQILVTNFAELFERELGYVDYVIICQKFPIIIVENVTIIDSDNTDLAVRFINFIDNAYFYKVILFMTLQDDPIKIYQNGLRQDEFKRTVSRLYEINSSSYVS